MIEYLKAVRGLTTEFTSWSIDKIPRAENCEADRLSKYASIAVPNLDEQEERVFVEYLPEKTTSTPLIDVLDISIGTPQPSWMDPILNYLKNGSLPPDRKEARSIIYKAANYTIINGVLYK